MEIAIITQARTGSTRLPGKVLKEIGGKSVLLHHVERLRISGLPVIVATTKAPSDQPIVDLCEHHEIPYYRGSEDNVLERYYDCMRFYHPRVIVRVTSDCPLIDGELIGRAARKYLGMDDPRCYFSNTRARTFPRGMDFEVFSFEMLKEAHANAAETHEKEHVTPYFYQENERKGIRIRQVTRSPDRSNYRLTLDTPEDFDLIRRLIEDHDAATLDADGLIALLDAHPELVAINAHVEQKKL